MQYDQKQFTQKGLNMFTSALSQKQPIVIDKVIVDDLPTNNFSNLALLSMDSFADALSYQANYTTVNGNLLTVDAVMSNKDFNSSYTINEVGLVGHINNDMSSQALIAVLVASDPFTLPAQQSGETPSQFIPNITLSFGDNNMNQVPVMVSDSAYIAQKDLDRLVSEYNYLKIGDADNRYVKQQDFNNEVNGAVNEKADKSYVDQNINQTNSKVSQKANQSDLNDTNDELNSHFGTGEIQNGNNLNTYTWDGCFYLTNVDIDTLTGHDGIAPGYQHFYGKMLVDSRNGYIIQTLYDNTTNMWYRYVGNSVTWHHVATDDNVNTINSRIDSLNNGKNDKVDSTNKFDYLNGVKADAGDTQGRINQTLSQATAHSDQNYNDLSNKNNILSNSIDSDKQTINDLKNKYNNGLSNDYQAPNLVDGSGELTPNPDDYLGAWHGKVADIPVKSGKRYWVTGDFNFGRWTNVGLSSQDDYSANINSSGFVINDYHYQTSFIAQHDGYYYLNEQRSSDGDVGTHKNLCITESDSYVPIEVANRNRLWNDRITNKTNDLSNQLNSHFGTGEIKNGYNLNTYTWDGSFYLNDVDIDTLTGHDGIAPGYNEFYGKMLVDSRNGYVFQTLYDNTNNMWYRYVGNGVQWQHVAKQSDIDNLGTDSTNKFNYMNTIKANTSDMNDHIQGAFNQANSYTDQRHDDLNYAKADKYDTYTKDDTDTRIAWAKAELNNNKQDKTDSSNKYAYLNGTKEDQSDATDKFNWMNTVKHNTADANQQFDQAIAHADQIGNSKQDKPGSGMINNGSNLDGYSWTGTFIAYDINLVTLSGNNGLPTSYSGFYGTLKVENDSGFTRQTLSDNIGNQWYRYLGNSTPWRGIATQDDIASIKANAWRELNVSGSGVQGSDVVCKVDWSNNTAKLIGNIYMSQGTTATVYPSNDFNFTTNIPVSYVDDNGGYDSATSFTNNGIMNVTPQEDITLSGQFSFSAISGHSTPTVSISPK